MNKTILMASLALLVCALPVRAAVGQELETQVRELARQNQALLERVAVLEQIVAAGKQSVPADLAPEPETAMAPADNGDQASGEQSLVRKLSEHLTLGGLVEVEANTARDFAGEESAAVTLATVALHLDARISEWAMAHALLLYEEGEEDDQLTVDEGTITLGNEEAFPGFLTAGRMYLPFTADASSMISMSLPLEIGEIADTTALAGVRHAGFKATVYALNGDLAEQGGGNRIDTWGGSLDYLKEWEVFSLDAGLGWLNNIGDTDGLGDYLEENTGAAELAQYVDGLAAHCILRYKPLKFIAEYVRALEEFRGDELAFLGSGAEPAAWSLEGGWTVDLLGRQTIFSLSWQGTAEARALGLPEERYLAALRICILAHTSLALEYLHDDDYAIPDGGTGGKSDSITMQLAVDF